MNAKTILEILLDQLAIEDPERIEIRGGDQSTADPVVDFIRRIVDGTCRNFGDHRDEKDSRLAISAALSRTADLLARTATALWQSAIFQRADSDRPRQIRITRPEQANGNFRTYLTALKHLGTAIARLRSSRMRIRITPDASREIEFLTPAFAFLAERRFELRKLLHPTACQYVPGVRCSETGADRGDQAASFYNALVLGSDLPEAPENWTLRDKPEYLQETLASLLCDLHHLAVASEISWNELQSEAQKVYDHELTHGG